MKDTKKKSLWARLTGTGSDCGCCCETIVEEIPEADKAQKEESKKTQETNNTK